MSTKNPKVFPIDSVVDHTNGGRYVVKAYYKGDRKPYDLMPEDGGNWMSSFRKDMKLAGPRPPEPYEEWFR